jgi:hypothetical protein
MYAYLSPAFFVFTTTSRHLLGDSVSFLSTYAISRLAIITIITIIMMLSPFVIIVIGRRSRSLVVVAVMTVVSVSLVCSVSVWQW